MTTDLYYTIWNHEDGKNLQMRVVKQYVLQRYKHLTTDGLRPYKGSPGGFKHRRFYLVNIQMVKNAPWWKTPNATEQAELLERYPEVRFK